MRIKLSKDIMKKARANSLKTFELIEYILGNVEGASSDKEIFRTALKDISFSSEGNKKPTKGEFDFVKEELILWCFVD